MTIFEIDRAIEELIAASINEETGELLIDPEKLEALQMERNTRVENLACFIKNHTAFVKALAEEERTLHDRRKREESEVERATRYLELVLDGEKFTSPRADVGYRRSTSLSLSDGFMEWAAQYAPELIRQKPEPDKKSITDRIKSGEAIPFADLVTNKKIYVK